MSLNEIYRKYLYELRKIYSEGEASQITSDVFETFAGISKSDVIKDPKRIIEEPVLQQLHLSLELLGKHTPVQYVTGYAWFYKMKFIVTPAVLIPRPETEELVTYASEFINNKKLSVLDIGTGSGCIAISIKKDNNNASVTATDISIEALRVAESNAETQETDVLFSKHDILDQNEWKDLGIYDVVISNPPYIPAHEITGMGKNVTLHEPHCALFVPENNPLIFYMNICSFCKLHLHKQGKVFLETHEQYAEELMQHFNKEGFNAAVVDDLSGKQRFVMATHSL